MAPRKQLTVAAVEKKLRAFCLSLPGTSEKASWGHPNFKAGKKTFAVLEQFKGEWVIAFKAEREAQQALIASDPRFYASPYVGAQGWVSMRLAAGVDWKRTAGFLLQSYRLVATKKLLAALDGP
jgi:predicted DNA-binding protein (MmcQ/YjbR family)